MIDSLVNLFSSDMPSEEDIFSILCGCKWWVLHEPAFLNNCGYYGYYPSPTGYQITTYEKNDGYESL